MAISKTETENWGGISSDAVKNKTGKSWGDWLKILNKEKADKLKHKDIAELLYEKYKLDGWWAQMVTVGFEQAAGLRVKNQKSTGDFSVDLSKVITISLPKLYAFFIRDSLRKTWLKEKFEMRTSTANKSIRANFASGTANLSVMFYDKGKGKSSLVITESKLGNQKHVEKNRLFWKRALGKLEKELL